LLAPSHWVEHLRGEGSANPVRASALAYGVGAAERSRIASAINTMPVAAANAPNIHAIVSAPAPGKMNTSTPNAIEGAPLDASSHSPVISWRKRIAPPIYMMPVAIAHTATNRTRVNAVSTG